MQAIGIEQVDGERGADPDQQDFASVQRRQQGEEAIHAEMRRIVVGDAQAGATCLRAHQVQPSEARAQRIEQGHAPFARGHAGDAGGIAPGQFVQPCAAIGMGKRPRFAGRTIGARPGELQARVAEVEQPGVHVRTLTSPACTRRSRPASSRTRNAPSSAMPRAVAGHAPSPSCTCKARPDSASSAA